MDKVVIPAEQVPSYRTSMAIKRRAENNLIFTTWGGIGDQICAEPTLRYAIDVFKDASVSLATEFPELYAHLKFKKVYDLRKKKPEYKDYLVLQTITTPESLTWEFVSHCVTHCVDFPSICSLRCTLPIEYKTVKLCPSISDEKAAELSQCRGDRHVAIHAGKHWPSKTFPKYWWDEVILKLQNAGFIPVLFGKDMDKMGVEGENRGTVDTTVEGCVDLRNKLTVSESIWLLQRMKFLVCNDSSPLHMAVDGGAHIAFVASAKHQDYIYHWRRNEAGRPEWAWRMKHFNSGGIWDVINHCPNAKEKILVDQCDADLLKSWLPQPEEIVSWICEKSS